MKKRKLILPSIALAVMAADVDGEPNGKHGPKEDSWNRG